MGVRRLVVANGPNIFQMLLVSDFLAVDCTLTFTSVFQCTIKYLKIDKQK